MAEKNDILNAAEATSNREIVNTRIMHAPREVVFKAWTDPEHLKKWWGPKGFRNTFHQFELKPGGTWEFIMHGPDGTNYPNKSIFEEIIPNERIVFTHLSGHKFRVTATFEVVDARQTRLTFHMLFDTVAEYEATKPYAVEGNEQNFDRLEAELRNMQGEKSFTLERVFNAPRELVFKAWTEAKHLQHWWGPKGLAVHVKTLDLRPGGMFHYSMQAPDGTIMWGRFIYKEITAPRRIVFVSSFSDADGNITAAPFPGVEHFPKEIYNVVTFTEQDGKTTVSMSGGPINASAGEREFYEQMFGSMQQGFAGTFEQLDNYLAQMN